MAVNCVQACVVCMQIDEALKFERRRSHALLPKLPRTLCLRQSNPGPVGSRAALVSAMLP